MTSGIPRIRIMLRLCFISGERVETVPSIYFLCVQITEDLNGPLTPLQVFPENSEKRQTGTRTAGNLLPLLYREHQNCILAWYLSCTAADRRVLQHVYSSSQRIIGTQLPVLEDRTRCLRKATNICKDFIHPGHDLSELLSSGRHHKAIYARTTRFNSFPPDL